MSIRNKKPWIFVSAVIILAVGLAVILHLALYRAPETLPPYIQGDGFYIYRQDKTVRNNETIEVLAEYNGLPVKVIAENAFKNLKNLKTVILPDSITEIQDNAFRGCTALEGIIIPAAVTKIGYNAFRDCSAITEVTIPANVKTLSAWTFADCTALTSVTLLRANDEVQITPTTFENCTALDEILVPLGIISYYKNPNPLPTWAPYQSLIYPI